MADLRALCTEIGLENVRTYIQSGNVIFWSDFTEEVVLREREIFIHYPNGMGRSKLKLPLTHKGTVRNMNTINKLL